MIVFWTLCTAVGLLFAIVLIAILLRGSYRKFPFLLAYFVAQVLTTVAESASYFQIRGWSEFGRTIYWVDEIILQVLVFSLVISLVSKALENAPQQKKVRAYLAVGALAVMGMCIWFEYDPGRTLTHWMTDASRNLSFASAILNLFLWSVILGQRNRDAQLLAISGGLGIQTTGRAIGHSLRILKLTELGNILVVATYMLSLLVIWWALRKPWPKHIPGASPFDRPRLEE